LEDWDVAMQTQAAKSFKETSTLEALNAVN
jgi:hypothetical protein